MHVAETWWPGVNWGSKCQMVMCHMTADRIFSAHMCIAYNRLWATSPSPGEQIVLTPNGVQYPSAGSLGRSDHFCFFVCIYVCFM